MMVAIVRRFLTCLALCAYIVPLCHAFSPPLRHKQSKLLGLKPMYSKSRSSLLMSTAATIPDPAPKLELPEPVPPMKFKFMPIRWLAKFLSVYVMGTISFVLLFAVNMVFSLAFLIFKPWMRKIVLKRFAGFMMTYSMTPWVEMKFDWGRMLSYVPFLMQADNRFFSLKHKMRSADELVGKPRLPTDDVFVSQVILRSPLAFYTNNTDDKLISDVSAMNDLVHYENTYFGIERIEVDKATQAITIFLKNPDPAGGPPIPVTRASDGDEAFTRAIQAAMATLSYFIPGIGHSWVHFLFPDAVAATVHNDLDKSSVLYKLLEPHSRYTSRINWEALGVRGPLVWGSSALVRMAAEATTTCPRGVPPDALAKKFQPWAPFPMTAQEFVRKNSERTTDYYFRSGEFACPPKWFEGVNAELPYIKSIKRFYPVVRSHVEKVLEYEDKDRVKSFIAAVDENSRIDGFCLNLHKYDAIDVIASFIFDASFIHSTDHYFTNRVFAETRYGIGTLRHPYTTEWYPGFRIPQDIQDEEDRVRFKGFADIFIRFNDSKLISNNMKNLKYKFRKSELKSAAKDFIYEITAEQDKMKSDGDIFCPLEDMSRSICF